jgi:hypothetical protein
MKIDNSSFERVEQFKYSGTNEEEGTVRYGTVSQNTTVLFGGTFDLPYLLPHLHILNTTGMSQLKIREQL